MKKLLITGGSGILGTALVNLPFEKIFIDRMPVPAELSAHKFVQGDITDLDFFRSILEGCDVLIHLAGCSDSQSKDQVIISDIWNDNIRGTKNAFDVAHEQGVERILFASSNHTVGMYEIENRPRIYEIGHGICLDKNVPLRPDSFYGVSKVFAESYGRYLAETGGPKFYALRIGSVRAAHEDHPYAYAEWGVRKGHWTRGSHEYVLQEKRLKAIWQSRRDFLQMVSLCITYNGPPFDIFYGVSDNDRRWFDIEYAKQVLGYRPLDNSDKQDFVDL